MDEEAFVALRVQHPGGWPLCICFCNQHVEMCYHVPTRQCPEKDEVELSTEPTVCPQSPRGEKHQQYSVIRAHRRSHLDFHVMHLFGGSQGSVSLSLSITSSFILSVTSMVSLPCYYRGLLSGLPNLLPPPIPQKQARLKILTLAPMGLTVAWPGVRKLFL